MRRLFWAGGNPDLRKADGLGINRKTWSWNAAAAVFAYGYGTLAELQYKYVGQDQLIGGTWPDVRSDLKPCMTDIYIHILCVHCARAE